MSDQIDIERNTRYGTYSIDKQDYKRKKQNNKDIRKIILGLLIFIPISYLFIFGLPLYGQQSYIRVPDLIQIKEIDQVFTPNYEDGSRLVLIGDVHGMIEPFTELLDAINFDKSKDHLLLLGDMITKGDHSMQVLELAIELNAACVRGNHEDETLQYYAEKNSLDLQTEQEKLISIQSISKTDQKFIRKLRSKHIQFLGQCPLIMRLGPVSEDGYEVVAVHGGLMWNIPTLEDQDPEAVMNIRTLLPPQYTRWSDKKDELPWDDKWNDHQETLSKENRTVVYYGHNAHMGLNIRKYSRGLDSSCFKGNSLSATVISQNQNGQFVNEVISVDCYGKE